MSSAVQTPIFSVDQSQPTCNDALLATRRPLRNGTRMGFYTKFWAISSGLSLQSHPTSVFFGIKQNMDQIVDYTLSLSSQYYLLWFIVASLVNFFISVFLFEMDRNFFK